MKSKGIIKLDSKYNGRSTSLLAGWLIDGTGKPARKNVLITISEGVFVKIDPIDTGLDSFKKRLPDGWVDFSGYTIIPALADCHVHLFMSGTDDLKIRQLQLEAGFEEIMPVISAHIHSHLANGVMALRDGADRLGHTMRYKMQCPEMKNTPIRLKVAGKAWHRQGRYGKLIARSPKNGETLAYAIRKDLAGLHPEKPDHIKIVNSGINSLLNFGKQTAPQFDFNEMKDAVKVAQDHGLPVMVHANGVEPVKIAVEAGCRSIEHGFFMGEENLRRMADQGTFWVPTACTMKGYADTIAPGSRENIAAQKYLDHQLKQINLGKKLAVPMATGTDAGSMGVHHGRAIFEELRLFVRAGFSIEEAICCGAGNASNLLGIKRAGTISLFKEASFVAINGGPGKLLDHVENNLVVFVKGKEL